MTRHDHRGRFTAGSIPAPRETGAPLLCARVKSAPHVAGAMTKRAKWIALRDKRTDDLRAGR